MIVPTLIWFISPRLPSIERLTAINEWCSVVHVLLINFYFFSCSLQTLSLLCTFIFCSIDRVVSGRYQDSMLKTTQFHSLWILLGLGIICYSNRKIILIICSSFVLLFLAQRRKKLNSKHKREKKIYWIKKIQKQTWWYFARPQHKTKERTGKQTSLLYCDRVLHKDSGMTVKRIE